MHEPGIDVPEGAAGNEVQRIVIVMESRPLRTSVIGSYPFPSWLEFAGENLDRFGSAHRPGAVRSMWTAGMPEA